MRDKLLSKQFRTFSKLSRYSIVPYYYSYNDKCLTPGSYTGISTSTPYVPHKVAPGDTLDSLSLYYYNNPVHYWIIAEFNSIVNPFEDLKVGSILKIPTFSSIEFKT